ncbi:hypothetical protein [Sphingomonas sp.]|uniref:hypothetical protein n=1 Tax=Sphingomonas sp. TaxID=28214 RepID=UPI002CD0A9AA|nr:hypothetical protein [Sphingomonas sp.]HTG38031.1 hypothetical protein [Sphingomonas sp.]
MGAAMGTNRIEMAEHAAKLRAQGLTLKQIGTRIGRSEGEVSRLLRSVISAAA